MEGQPVAVAEKARFLRCRPALHLVKTENAKKSVVGQKKNMKKLYTKVDLVRIARDEIDRANELKSAPSFAERIYRMRCGLCRRVVSHEKAWSADRDTCLSCKMKRYEPDEVCIADEVVRGIQRPELADFRPARFFN